MTSSATNYFCGKPAPRAALPGTSTLVAPWPHRRSPHDAISAQLNASAAAPRPAPCPAPPRRCPGVGAQAAPARPSPKGPERGLQVERSGSAIRPGCRGSVPGLPGWLRASGLPAAFCEKPRGEVPPHTPCVCVCVFSMCLHVPAIGIHADKNAAMCSGSPAIPAVLQMYQMLQQVAAPWGNAVCANTLGPICVLSAPTVGCTQTHPHCHVDYR